MSGFLFLINDGEFVNKLMYFKYEIDKIYVVKVKGILFKELFRKLECGIRFEEGKMVFVKVKLLFLDKKK